MKQTWGTPMAMGIPWNPHLQSSPSRSPTVTPLAAEQPKRWPYHVAALLAARRVLQPSALPQNSACPMKKQDKNSSWWFFRAMKLWNRNQVVSSLPRPSDLHINSNPGTPYFHGTHHSAHCTYAFTLLTSADGGCIGHLAAQSSSNPVEWWPWVDERIQKMLTVCGWLCSRLNMSI